MRIANAFQIGKPLDAVWPVLNDVPRVARCIPGAEVVEATATHYQVKVPVRFGIVPIVYHASIEVMERDDENHAAVLKVEGKQIIGGGNVRAFVKVTAHREGQHAHVFLDTDAELGGFVATVGRPIVDAVARTMVAKFAEKLESMIE
jgi:carbon monoxide dehydrogenase subunit G